MHLESVASCKASLQMKGRQKKREEVKGRKQSEKKIPSEKEGGKRRGMVIKFSLSKV